LRARRVWLIRVVAVPIFAGIIVARLMVRVARLFGVR
jgi:hypothetical protein